MRWFAGQLLAPLLTALLALTTPVGTGEGVHQDQLLHPVFAHTHLIDGRMVSDAQLAAALAAASAELTPSPPTRGPALGAGSGADGGGAGLALGPTLPATTVPFQPEAERRVFFPERAAPVEFREPPEDPPPVTFA